MNEIGKKALQLHDEGNNCAQAVLCAMEEQTGLDSATARSIASAFGGGLRSGEACGAFVGAVAALGLVLAKDGDGAKTAIAADAARELRESFKNEFGCMRCEELLAIADKSKCSEYIAYCAAKSAELAEKYKK